MGNFICRQKQNTADLLFTPKNRKGLHIIQKGASSQIHLEGNSQIKVPRLSLRRANQNKSLNISTRRKEFQEPNAERGLQINLKKFQKVYKIPQFKQTVRKSTELSPLVSYIVHKIQNNSKSIALEIRTDQLNDEADFNLNLQKYVNLIHSNIIQLEEYFFQKEYYYIIMEYCDSVRLQTMIEKKKESQQFFTEREISLIASQLLKACSYMHWNSIIHKNINPQNIQLIVNKEDNIQHIKLSNYFQVERLLNNSMQNSNTLDFQAPEEMFGRNETEKIDVWSIGIIIFYLYTGRKLLEGDITQEDYKALYSNDFNIQNQVQLRGCSEMVAWMLTRMLVVDAELRISAQDALKVLSFELLSSTGTW